MTTPQEGPNPAEAGEMPNLILINSPALHPDADGMGFYDGAGTEPFRARVIERVGVVADIAANAAGVAAGLAVDGLKVAVALLPHPLEAANRAGSGFAHGLGHSVVIPEKDDWL